MTIRKVLIIYTGGTIGMKQSPYGYRPAKGWMEKQLSTIYAFQDPEAAPRTTPPSKKGKRISYDIVEYDPLLDSANMEVHHWVKIAHEIEKHYDSYDGFVVLHGTDTMSYTASALFASQVARPDIATAVQRLCANVSRWTVHDD